MKLRSELKSVIFGKFKIIENLDNNLILFTRFFKPEKNVLVLLNLNKNISIVSDQLNHNIKDLNIKNKLLEIDYSYLSQPEINNIRNIKFDKNGFLIDVEIPELCFYVSSFGYSPEIKDLL